MFDLKKKNSNKFLFIQFIQSDPRGTVYVKKKTGDDSFNEQISL